MRQLLAINFEDVLLATSICENGEFEGVGEENFRYMRRNDEKEMPWG